MFIFCSQAKTVFGPLKPSHLSVLFTWIGQTHFTILPSSSIDYYLCIYLPITRPAPSLHYAVHRRSSVHHLYSLIKLHTSFTVGTNTCLLKCLSFLPLFCIFSFSLLATLLHPSKYLPYTSAHSPLCINY